MDWTARDDATSQYLRQIGQAFDGFVEQVFAQGVGAKAQELLPSLTLNNLQSRLPELPAVPPLNLRPVPPSPMPSPGVALAAAVVGRPASASTELELPEEALSGQREDEGSKDAQNRQ